MFVGEIKSLPRLRLLIGLKECPIALALRQGLNSYEAAVRNIGQWRKL